MSILNKVRHVELSYGPCVASKHGVFFKKKVGREARGFLTARSRQHSPTSTIARVKNRDKTTSIWRFCNISPKGPQTTPTCNPKLTGLLHDAHKNQTQMLRLLQNIFFEAKSATEKFDLDDTAQSENTIRFNAIFN
jgi:hypothetical protein